MSAISETLPEQGTQSRMRLLLARVVWAVHTAIFAYFVIAWTLPWDWSLWSCVIGYPLLQINWWSFGNRCILTIVEERLRGPDAKRHVAEDDAEEPLNFTAEILSRALGRPVPHWTADVLSYGIVWGGFTLSALRLWLRS